MVPTTDNKKYMSVEIAKEYVVVSCADGRLLITNLSTKKCPERAYSRVISNGLGS
jgi:hypothetical protein